MPKDNYESLVEFFKYNRHWTNRATRAIEQAKDGHTEPLKEIIEELETDEILETEKVEL